jgi:hypothetical protein
VKNNTPTISKWTGDGPVEPFGASPQYVVEPQYTESLKTQKREPAQQPAKQDSCTVLGCTVSGRWLMCTCIATNVPPQKIVTVTPYGDLIIDVGRMVGIR